MAGSNRGFSSSCRPSTAWPAFDSDASPKCCRLRRRRRRPCRWAPASPASSGWASCDNPCPPWRLTATGACWTAAEWGAPAERHARKKKKRKETVISLCSFHYYALLGMNSFMNEPQWNMYRTLGESSHQPKDLNVHLWWEFDQIWNNPFSVLFWDLVLRFEKSSFHSPYLRDWIAELMLSKHQYK